MKRQPLADQLPYRFFPPTIQSWAMALARPYIDHLMRREQKVVAFEFSGVEHLEALQGRGDGILITPNHADHADCGIVFELARRLRRPFYYMAAYQIFVGLNRTFLPRLGVFPVDREGSDITAMKTGIDLLARGEHPLVVFPEGEIYFQSDRLTPLREGAASLACTAAKQAARAGRNVWIVPAGIKLRFVDGHDPSPAFLALMDRLEARFTWRRGRERPLVERIYRYAEGMIGLKELEYLGRTQTGPLPVRISSLRDAILEAVEDRRLGRRKTDPVPARVKECRRACLDALAEPKTTPEEAASLRRDLEDLFGVIQLYSYPGDYVRECPTLERVAEILMKLEEDVEGVDQPAPLGPRRAEMRLGPPIDVRAALDAAGGRSRQAAQALTDELEGRMQGLLDAMGPGHRIAPGATPAVETAPALQSSSA
jgi:1-acyl-sn-glycerol-3-phosphate acyltransferase